MYSSFVVWRLATTHWSWYLLQILFQICLFWILDIMAAYCVTDPELYV